MADANPIRWFAKWLSDMRGWRRPMIAMLAGAVSALAFAPVFAAPVLLVTFPALFWLAFGHGDDPDQPDRPGPATHAPSRLERLRRAAICGWCFGFGIHLAGLYWIGSAFLVEAERFAWVMPFAVASMPAGLALFYAAALAAVSQIRGSDLVRAIAMALALAGAEWLRGTIFTGFPWNALGYVLTYPLILMQSAGLIGIYGLSLFAVLIATLPLVAIAGTSDKTHRLRTVCTLAGLVGFPMVAAPIYGMTVLAQPLPPDLDGLRIRLVQPNIPQTDKFQPDKHRDIFLKTLALSTQPSAAPGTTSGNQQITHILWPEASMPFFALRSKEVVAGIASALEPQQHLIAGTLRAEVAKADADPSDYRVFNTTIVLDGNGSLKSIYDKVHLVPFGEYLPFQNTLEAIGLMHLTRQRGGFSPGPSPRRLMQIPGLPPASMLICYEAIFPHLAHPSDGRPGLLINLTNDAWFGTTSGPYQHFHQSRVRAVEQGVPLIRVANNGITAITDSHGRIRHRIGLNRRGVIDSSVPAVVRAPLYAQLGDLIFALLWLAVAAFWGLLCRLESAQIGRVFV